MTRPLRHPLAVLLVVFVATLARGQDTSAPFVFGFDIARVENGGIIEGASGFYIDVSGFLTITGPESGYNAWNMSAVVSSSNEALVCLRVFATEDDDYRRRVLQCRDPVHWLVPNDNPPSTHHVVQSAEHGCEAGSVESNTPENGGQRGLLHTETREADPFLVSFGFSGGPYRVLPFMLRVQVPPAEEDLTVTLRYVNGLVGPNGPVNNSVVWDDVTYEAEGAEYSFVVRGIPPVGDDPFNFGFDVPSVENGGTLVAAPCTTIEIPGHVILSAKEPGVRGWTMSAEMRSSDDKRVCLDVPATEPFTFFDLEALARTQGVWFGVIVEFAFPAAFIIQDTDFGCEAGTGDPSDPENAGRRGIVYSEALGFASLSQPRRIVFSPSSSPWTYRPWDRK